MAQMATYHQHMRHNGNTQHNHVWTKPNRNPSSNADTASSNTSEIMSTSDEEIFRKNGYVFSNFVFVLKS